VIKGAIFDLDGTILDSMFIWDSIGEDYLRSLGKEPKENLKETFKTFTLEESAKYYIDNYGITLSVDEIINGVNKMVEEYYVEKIQLKKGVHKFLEKLKEKGVKMCIATVTDEHLARAALKRCGVEKYFSKIFTCESVRCGKENPKIYREAQKHLGTEKSETIVFEDALHALKTAKDDGFKVAAVYDKYEIKQDEMKEFSDYYITDFENFSFKPKMKTSLTIAGSDSSGGAGIQADIKTMCAHGVYAMSAITALTAQNTLGVRSIFPSSPDFLKEQLDAVFEDIFPDSVKIGMVSSKELAEVIYDRLKFYNAKNIVVDPVMVATSGSTLIKTDAIKVLADKIFPIATVVTPNIFEAEVLSGIKICDDKDMIKAAKIINEMYGCSVLLKGGHSKNNANDILYENGMHMWFEGERIDNPNAHGTGCTLSSAIASNLAKGYSLEESVKKAKDYVYNALLDGLDLGKGLGPLNHMFFLNE